MKIAIIGMGRFGRLLYDLFSESYEVVAFSRDSEKLKNINGVSLLEAASADIIIPSVPISALSDQLKQLAPMIKPDAIVVDVCSVKTFPAKQMLEILPATVQIVGTHPIWGPDSVRLNNGASGLVTVITPIRADQPTLDLILSLFAGIGNKIEIMTPEEHDRNMAYSLLYTHTIGRMGEKMGIKSTPINTKGFEKLLEVQQYVVNDTWQLFADMNKYNVFAKEMRHNMLNALVEIDKSLTNS